MQIPLLSQLAGDLSVWTVVLILLLVLIGSFYVYATSYHGVWEKVGVPGPKPLPIIDHKLELNHGVDAAVRRWFQIYGNTFGAYGLFPHRATLITKDLSLLKHILVKDFDNFIERSRIRQTHSSIRFGLTSIAGDKWRRIRHVTSPMFTGARMKIILRHVDDSAKTLSQLAKEKTEKGQLIPLKDFAAKFATEVIARIGFGLQSHAVSDTETEFAYYARNIIKFHSGLRNWVGKIHQYFPHIDKILPFLGVDIDFIRKDADSYFTDILNSTIKERKGTRAGMNDEKARDLLDMLVNAGVDDKDPRLNDINSKALSHNEILGNSTMLIMAGVETVSTAFQSLLYSLALYPDIQEKVIAEIDSVFPKEISVEYEQMSELKYTEQVINESLRLYPLVSTIFRIAAETKTYDKITIPKGSYVQIPLGEIMKDPEHWPDPEVFDPERFSPENKAGRDPLAFMPFGYGPRICLGMRLAMMELKIVLAHLLKEVRFTLSERTEPKKGEKLKVAGFVIVRPLKPIMLEAVRRTN